MHLGEALIARLKADAGVQALAGSRIFWVARPQKGPGNQLPAVVLQVISGDRPQHLDGFEDMATAQVQANSFAREYGESRILAEAVSGALVDEAQVDDIVFWRGDVGEPRDLGEQTDDGFIFHAAVEVTVRWGRAEAA
ncbi:MAG TPA: DUF3168 domain-containing protein [Sphingomicrobium sp.]|jgi:hypothetical protein